MSTIIINGKKITVDGNNISISNGTVTVDGKVIVTEIGATPEIKWEGPAANIRIDQGNLTCQDVSGDVEVGGSMKCRSISKSAQVGGSLTADSIEGNVTAGGSINCRK